MFTYSIKQYCYIETASWINEPSHGFGYSRYFIYMLYIFFLK